MRFLVLFLLVPVVLANYVDVGGLFPLGAGMGGLGWMSKKAAELAVEYVNEHLDEFGLPCFVRFSAESTGQAEPSVAAAAMFAQVSPTLPTENRSVVFVGPAYSSVSSKVDLLAVLFDTPLISYSATSSVLSGSSLFARTVSPQYLQARALAATVESLGWTDVATLNVADATTRSFISDFRIALSERNLVGVRIQEEFAPLSEFRPFKGGPISAKGDAEFEAGLMTALRAIAESNTRVIVLNAYMSEVRRVLWAASRLGWIGSKTNKVLGSSTHPFVFLGTDFWATEQVIPSDLAAAAENGCNITCVEALREPGLLNGMMLARSSQSPIDEELAIMRFLSDHWNPKVGSSQLSAQEKQETALDSWVFPNISFYAPFAWDAVITWAHTLSVDCQQAHGTSATCSQCQAHWTSAGAGSRMFDLLLGDVVNESSPVFQQLSWNGTATGPIKMNEEGDRVGEFDIVNMAPRKFVGRAGCEPLQTVWKRLNAPTECASPIVTDFGGDIGTTCINLVGLVSSNRSVQTNPECFYWPRDLPTIPPSSGPCRPGFERKVASNGVRFCVECDANTFNNDLGEDCEPCPDGGVCEGGSALAARRGSWYSPWATPTSLKFEECRPDPNVCCPNTTCDVQLVWSLSKELEAELSGVAPDITFLSDGMLRQPNSNSTFCTGNRAGILCGGCQEGFSLWGQECLRCDRSRADIVFGVIVLCTMLLVFLMFRRNTPEAESRLVIDYLQTFSFLLTPVPGSRSVALTWLSNEVFALNIWSVFGVARQSTSQQQHETPANVNSTDVSTPSSNPVDLGVFCPFPLSPMGSVLLPLSIPGIVLLIWLCCAAIFRRHKMIEACRACRCKSKVKRAPSSSPKIFLGDSKLSTPKITTSTNDTPSSPENDNGDETVTNPLADVPRSRLRNTHKTSPMIELSDRGAGVADAVEDWGGKADPTPQENTKSETQFSAPMEYDTSSDDNAIGAGSVGLRQRRRMSAVARRAVVDLKRLRARRHRRMLQEAVVEESAALTGLEAEVVCAGSEARMETPVYPWGGKDSKREDDVDSRALLFGALAAATPLLLVVPWFYFVRALWRLYFLAYNQVVVTALTVLSCRSLDVPQPANITQLYDNVGDAYTPVQKRLTLLEEVPAVECWTSQHVTAVVCMAILLFVFVVVLPTSIITSYHGFQSRIRDWVVYRRKRRRRLRLRNRAMGAENTYKNRKSRNPGDFKLSHMRPTPRRDVVGVAMRWTPPPPRFRRQHRGMCAPLWSMLDSLIGTASLPFSSDAEQAAVMRGGRLRAAHPVPLARVFGYASSASEDESEEEEDVVAEALGWEDARVAEARTRRSRLLELKTKSDQDQDGNDAGSISTSSSDEESDDAELMLLRFVGVSGGLDAADRERLRTLGLEREAKEAELEAQRRAEGNEAQCCGIRCSPAWNQRLDPIRYAMGSLGATCCRNRDSGATPSVDPELLTRYFSAGRRFVSHAGLALDEVFIQYRPGVRSFFEVLMYGRRLLFALVLVFAAPEPETRQTLLFAVVILLLGIQLLFRPFMRPKDDAFSTCLLLLLVLVGGLEVYQVAKYLEDARSIDLNRQPYPDSSQARAITIVELIAAIFPVVYVARATTTRSCRKGLEYLQERDEAVRNQRQARFERVRAKATKSRTISPLHQTSSHHHHHHRRSIITGRQRTWSSLDRLPDVTSPSSSSTTNTPTKQKSVVRARRSILHRITDISPATKETLETRKAEALAVQQLPQSRRRTTVRPKPALVPSSSSSRGPKSSIISESESAQLFDLETQLQYHTRHWPRDIRSAIYSARLQINSDRLLRDTCSPCIQCSEYLRNLFREDPTSDHRYDAATSRPGRSNRGTVLIHGVPSLIGRIRNPVPLSSDEEDDAAVALGASLK